MKKYITILSFLFLTGLLYSQNFEIEWQQCLGGSMIDVAYDIVMVENGYIIAGGTGSNDGDISYSHGAGDGWLLRVDSLGNILWEKTYGGSDSEAFNRIIPTMDNNYYLVGLSWSSDGDISDDPYPNSPDYWIVKIDSLGNIIWDIIVGGNRGEMLFTGAPTDDGGVIAIGQTSSDDGDISEFYGGNDTWMVKISSNGELEWDFTIGTDFIDVGQAVIQTSDGGYLAASNSMLGEGGNITCEPHSNMAEAVLTKLDATRNIEWQHCYGGSDHDGILGILEIEDGYIFSAYTDSPDGDVSGWHGDTDIWIVKIDFEGNIIWEQCFGGYNGEIAFDIFQSDDNGFIIIGQTRSNDGDVSGNHSSSEFDNDVWMFKINNEGELLWQKCFGGAGSEAPSGTKFGVVKKSDHNFVIAGQTNWGPSYDVECTPHGQTPHSRDTDYWVFEIKDCTLYSAATPEKATGHDTICSANNAGSIYTTTAATNAWAYQWMIAPETAGTITGDSLQGTVSWSPDYEGTATIIVRSTNDCGESEWSQPHYTQVHTCLGVNELKAAGLTLKAYPNPATNYIIFELSVISNPLVVISRETTVGSDEKSPKNNPQKSPQIFITNTLGQQVAQLELGKNAAPSASLRRTVWDTKSVQGGMYFYKVEIDGKILSGKIVLLK